MIRKLLFVTFWLWIFWILLIATFEPVYLTIGFIVSFIISYISYYFLGEYLLIGKWSFSKFYRFLKYIFSSLKEIIVSNIDVAERVLDPKLPINPSVVKLDMPFKDRKFLFTLLANTITLTPGTLTIDHDNENIYVHFLAEEHIESLSNRNLPIKIEEIFKDPNNDITNNKGS